MGDDRWADQATIERLLEARGRWAVVGCSPRRSRDSHRVADYLDRKGFEVVPVNPTTTERILGHEVQPDLASAAALGPLDVVDVFRRSSEVGAVVDAAIAAGARAVWLQLGVVDEAAAARAAAAGLDVVMDRCPMIEIPRLALQG